MPFQSHFSQCRDCDGNEIVEIYVCWVGSHFIFTWPMRLKSDRRLPIQECVICYLNNCVSKSDVDKMLPLSLCVLALIHEVLAPSL